MPVDDLGQEVTFPHPPRRVVCLVPSLTEAIAASVPGVLVGATDWCTHPADLDVTRIRGTKNPDVATIVALAPDLVVANEEENRRIDVDRLRQAGLPVWVTRTDDVEGALRAMERLFSEAFGLPEAPAWLQEARRIWAEPAPVGALRAAIPIWRDPWLWIGSGTYAEDILTHIGIQNAGSEFGTRYPQGEPGDLPQDTLVLLPDEPYAFSPTDGPEALGGRAHVHVEGRWLFWYGPAMVEARAALADALDVSSW